MKRLFAPILVALALLTAGPAFAADPLVSVSWLAANRANPNAVPNVVVLDIRSAIDGGGAKAYQEGHVPGAVHSDYDKAGWRVERNSVPSMLPTVPELEKLIGELGIDEDSHVVVVPAGVHYSDFGSAARTYWTLKVAGVREVSILDGGFAAWKAAGQPIETGPHAPSPKIFTAALDKSLLSEAREVEELQSQGKATLIDARPASFFLGKEKHPAAKAYGHLPGAINLDSAKYYDAKTNRLKPIAELAALSNDIPAGPGVAYCNTGHWAATDWFVLHEILGRDVKLYSGSMVDWTSDPKRPVVSERTKWDDLKKTLGLGS